MNSPIASNWEKITLKDVVSEFISGGTPSTSIHDYWGGDIHWMRSANILNKEVFSGEKYITEKGLENSATKIVPKDNVLVATRVSLGNIAINRVDMAISQDLTGLVVNKGIIDENFLYYLLKTKEKKILSNAQGTTIKGILRSDLEKIKIDVPPLVEQRGIAEVLGTVDEAIRRTDAVIEKAEELKRGLMQRLLTRGIGHTEFKQTELGEIPKTWDIYRIKKVSQDIQYGYTASAKNNPVGPKFLRITDIKEGEVNWQDVPYCECSNSNFKKYKLNKGDLLFARTGATTGKSYLINEEKDAVFASYLIRIIPKETIDSYYLSVFFDSHLYWRQIQKSIVGSAQGGVNATTLSNLILPLPPKKEQEKIASIITDFKDKIKLEKRNKQIIEENKKGLMQILLSGKIRVELRESSLHKLKKYGV